MTLTTTGEESPAVPEQVPPMESLSPAPELGTELVTELVPEPVHERSHTPLESEMVMDDLAGHYRDYRRAKSPFELGRKENVLKQSSKAIIDKAAVMDISVPKTNVEEDIQNYFRHIYQNLIFDMASIQDITSFNEGANIEIVVVEEGEEPPATKEDAEDASQAKKKLRLNGDLMTHHLTLRVMTKTEKPKRKEKMNKLLAKRQVMTSSHQQVKLKKNRRHPNRMNKKLQLQMPK